MRLFDSPRSGLASAGKPGLRGLGCFGEPAQAAAMRASPAAWGPAPPQQQPRITPAPPGRRLRCGSVRQRKDPSAYGSMDELRAELERAGGPAGAGGFVAGLITWLSSAATSTASGALDPFKAAYRALLAARPSSAGGWDEELAALDKLEAEVGPEVVRQLSMVLLGTRQSTLRIIRRHPAVLGMPRGHLMERLIYLKGLFPASDVTRMVELQPAAFLGGDWAAVRRQLDTAAQLLQSGLAGADFGFMFQEDPAILFEPPESLRVGLRRLHELWAVDEAALANSDPLHLTLAVRALGTTGPPKGF